MAKTGKTVEQIIVEKLLTRMEEGVLPWERPWNAETGMPRNLKSNKPYRGVNVFMLGYQGFASPFWVTFNQATEMKGIIKESEKKNSSIVVYSKRNIYTKTDDETGEETERVGWIVRYTHVWNLVQTDGLKAPKIPKQVELSAFEKFSQCEKVGTEMREHVEIIHGASSGGRAFYRPVEDRIYLPDKTDFKTPVGYYSTRFHEMVHSTGHAKRLNRKTLTDASFFGDRNYCQEELVAEVGAALLCGHVGIANESLDNSVAYITGWLHHIKTQDPKAIYNAIQAAQKATDHILGVTFSTE
jgi:antirestriction protein ArdC